MATTAFNDLITFSRGSNATVVGSNGLIQWAPSNLLTNSQDFEAAAWSKVNATITANTTVAPDGTTTADTLIATTTGAQLYQTATLADSTEYAASVYLKKGSGSDWAYIRFRNKAGANFYLWANLATGVVGSTSGSPTSFSFSAAGNGWYRLCVAGSASTGGTTPYIYISSATADTVGSPAVNDQLLVWGAQLELGSTATTYNNTSVRNLLGFSEAFDNAAWTKTRASIVTGAQANPVNGLFNAQKLMEDTTASNSHAVSQSFTTIVGVPYTFSTYVKAAGRNFAAVYFSGPNRGIYVNLTTGAYAGDLIAAPTSYRIDAVGSGWFRVSITATATGTTTNAFIYTANSTPDYVYTGDGNSGVYIYGAQLSNSASLDPYVPTPGAAPSSTAYYGPRFDYDPVTLAARGFLVEEARTNLLTYSAEFDNAAWTKVNATVTANSAVAPDGTSTADLVTVTGASGRALQNCTYTAAAQTFSVYLKASTTADTLLRIVDVTPTTFTLTISWSGGVPSFVSNTGSSYAIQSVGNGWYRVSMTATTAAGAGTAQVFANGFGSSGATLIWGAQLEAGAFATSYIPTIASTVTRSADVATITGSLFSQWWNQPAGSFIVEVGRFSSVASAAVASFITVTDNPLANDWILMYGDSSGVTSSYTNAGASQATLTIASPIPTGGKTAFVYAANDFAAVVNGGAVSTDASGALTPDLTILRIGAFASNPNYLNGHIRSIRYVPARAADFQLQQVTT